MGSNDAGGGLGLKPSRKAVSAGDWFGKSATKKKKRKKKEKKKKDGKKERKKARRKTRERERESVCVCIFFHIKHSGGAAHLTFYYFY